MADDAKVLVDELESAVNRNLAEDGRLDAYDVDGAEVADEDELDADDEDEDKQELDSKKLDLNSDFDWDYFTEMKPTKRSWPQHDTSVLWQPSAINRYVTDLFSLVARAEKVASVLARVRKPKA